MSMNIALMNLTHTTSPGGVQRVSIVETYMLNKAGYRCKLLALFRPRIEWNLLHEYDVTPIYISKGEIRGRLILNPPLYYAICRRLIRYMDSPNDLHVIISHNIPCAHIALNVVKRLRHSVLLAYIHDANKYTISGTLYSIMQRYASNKIIRLQRDIIIHSNYIIVNSKKTLSKLLESYSNLEDVILNKSKILYPTVNNPTSRNIIKRDRKFISILGRLDHKAFIMFARIIKLLFNHIAIPVIVACSYNPYNKVSLRILRMLYKLKEKYRNLHILEFPSDSIVREIFRNSYVFLYPGHENFNMSAIEAASVGCPPLVPSSSGICELFDSLLRRELCVSSTERPEIWVKRLRELIETGEYYKLGLQCWELTQKFNVNYHIKTLEDIIRSVIT